MTLDCTYRVHIPHKPGQLALVAGAIARGHGLIGDVTTVTIGREMSVRETTVEVKDQSQADAIASDLQKLAGVQVVWFRDRALLRHEGGKLTVEPIHPVRGLQDLR